MAVMSIPMFNFIFSCAQLLHGKLFSGEVISEPSIQKSWSLTRSEVLPVIFWMMGGAVGLQGPLSCGTREPHGIFTDLHGIHVGSSWTYTGFAWDPRRTHTSVLYEDSRVMYVGATGDLRGTTWNPHGFTWDSHGPTQNLHGKYTRPTRDPHGTHIGASWIHTDPHGIPMGSTRIHMGSP